MKETPYKCPVCGKMLYWDDNTSGELIDPKAAWDDGDAEVKEAQILRYMSCWTSVDVPCDMVDLL